MKNTGTLRIQTFAARQSAPVEGVTVAVQGDGFTLHRITDATGSAADIPVEAPACTLSLDEDNTIRPYAVVSLTATKPGYRTVRIEGIQIFAGQITLAQPAMIPWSTYSFPSLTLLFKSSFTLPSKLTSALFSQSSRISMRFALSSSIV